jgi:hypothetical protein
MIRMMHWLVSCCRFVWACLLAADGALLGGGIHRDVAWPTWRPYVGDGSVMSTNAIEPREGQGDECRWSVAPGSLVAWWGATESVYRRLGEALRESCAEEGAVLIDVAHDVSPEWMWAHDLSLDGCLVMRPRESSEALAMVAYAVEHRMARVVVLGGWMSLWEGQVGDTNEARFRRAQEQRRALRKLLELVRETDGCVWVLCDTPQGSGAKGAMAALRLLASHNVDG